MYKIYWIKYLDHNDPLKEGYIGLTSQTIQTRFMEHKGNKKNKLLANRCKKENVEVSIKNQTITIRASTKEEKKAEEKGKFFRKEISRGEFQRILALPDNVDDEKATATFKEGVLTVCIPKTEQSKRKTITIN